MNTYVRERNSEEEVSLGGVFYFSFIHVDNAFTQPCERVRLRETLRKRGHILLRNFYFTIFIQEKTAGS